MCDMSLSPTSLRSNSGVAGRDERQQLDVHQHIQSIFRTAPEMSGHAVDP